MKCVLLLLVFCVKVVVFFAMCMEVKLQIIFSLLYFLSSIYLLRVQSLSPFSFPSLPLPLPLPLSPSTSFSFYLSLSHSLSLYLSLTLSHPPSPCLSLPGASAISKAPMIEHLPHSCIMLGVWRTLTRTQTNTHTWPHVPLSTYLYTWEKERERERERERQGSVCVYLPMTLPYLTLPYLT